MMPPTRSLGPAYLLKSPSGRNVRGFLHPSLSYRQLLCLTATVLLTGLLTVPPSLATLNALSSSSPGQQDPFASASPTTPHTAAGGADAVAEGSDAAAASAKGSDSIRGLAEQQQQQQQQLRKKPQQQQQQEEVPVDVVYLWVNGSDPELQEELKRFQPRAAPAAAKPVVAAAAKQINAAASKVLGAATAAGAGHKGTAAVQAAVAGGGAGKPVHVAAAVARQGPATAAAIKPGAVAAHAPARPPSPPPPPQQQQQQQQQQLISKGATRHLMARPDPAAASTRAAAVPAPSAAATTVPTPKAGQQPATTAAKQQGQPAAATGTAANAAAAGMPGRPATGATPAQPPAVAATPVAVKPAPLPVFKAPPGVTVPHAPASIHPQQQQQQQQQQSKGATHPAPKAAPKPTAPKPPAPKGVPLPLSELPTRQARFDAGRDELRYSLRALEQHLPWYRHLYIVTNGQVPSWLDVSNPRVTIVPHSSIFKNASHLPSFNSNAIQANLAHIPGLSPHFIMMDDDLFLTAPWSRDDFLGADGGQITAGTALASGMTGVLPIYMKSIQRLVGVFQQRFGPWRRTLPSHAPHFLEVQWLNKMWRDLPGEYEQTSATHLRTAKDVVIAAAYQWYISQFQPGQHPTAPESRSTFVSLSNWIAMCYRVAAVNDIRINPDAAMYRLRVKLTKPFSLAINAEATVGIAAALEDAAAGKPPRQYLVKQRANHTAELGKVFDQPGVKMVCLNDDIDDLYAAARPLINPTVVDFLAARYPTPSQYELASGQLNGCNRRVKVEGFGHLPTAADMAAACTAPTAPTSAAVLTTTQQHTKQGHRKYGPQQLQQQEHVAGVATA